MSQEGPDTGVKNEHGGLPQEPLAPTGRRSSVLSFVFLPTNRIFIYFRLPIHPWPLRLGEGYFSFG